jgi:flagellar motor switch protein FliM
VSGGSLSTDQIADLVEKAKHGELPPADANQPQRRNARLRTVDFSRPTKFTSDHQRRIDRALETFCQTAVTRLSAELRWPVEMELINTMQLTWAAAQTQLPPGSLVMSVDVMPLGTSMLMTVEQSFIVLALEAMLGGSPSGPPQERRFSEIDWVLTRRLLETIVNQLSIVWDDLAQINLQAGQIDEDHNDGSQIASVSESTYVTVVEIRLNKQSAALELLIPWIAIEPVSARISGHERTEEEEEVGAPPIGAAVANAPVTVRAEVASTEMAVGDILALQPGSVIAFDGKVEDGVTLFAENVRIARAQPGASGRRRAVQIRGKEWS